MCCRFIGCLSTEQQYVIMCLGLRGVNLQFGPLRAPSVKQWGFYIPFEKIEILHHKKTINQFLFMLYASYKYVIKCVSQAD